MRVATIGKHTDKPGVWCVFVTCVPCDVCEHTGRRILSTHASRDGAATSANQVNRAEAGS